MHSALSSTVGVTLSYSELDLAHTKSYTQAESGWNGLTHSQDTLVLSLWGVPGEVVDISCGNFDSSLIHSAKHFAWCTLHIGLRWWLSSKKSACNAGATGNADSIPGSGRSPGEGYGNPLQYFCLENPMDTGVSWATDHRVEKSQTWLKWLSMCALYRWVKYVKWQCTALHSFPNFESVSCSICNSNYWFLTCI